MHQLSDAFVVLPGGLGTYEEFFEILTWRQLGFHDKPIVVVDTEGYYGPLRGDRLPRCGRGLHRRRATRTCSRSSTPSRRRWRPSGSAPERRRSRRTAGSGPTARPAPTTLDPMRIAVVGGGVMGGTLAEAMARAGQRRPRRDRAQRRAPCRARGAGPLDAPTTSLPSPAPTSSCSSSSRRTSPRAARRDRRGRSSPAPPSSRWPRASRIATIEAALPDGVAVVRAMPNTPALVGRGHVRRLAGQPACPTDQLARRRRRCWGPAARSSSSTSRSRTPSRRSPAPGPAYVFYLAEAMIAGGVDEGLDRGRARTLTVQTLVGAAKLLAESDDDARGAAPPGDVAERHDARRDHDVRRARRQRRADPRRRARRGRPVRGAEADGMDDRAVRRLRRAPDRATTSARRTRWRPVRVELTMALAERARHRSTASTSSARAPATERRAAQLIHSAPTTSSGSQAQRAPDAHRPVDRPRHRGQPGVRATCTRPAPSSPARASRRRAGSGPGRRQRAINISGGLHHAMPRPRERLLHLQRRRAGDPVAARQRCAEDRLRRRRRPPRRRRADDVLGRPAGADDLDPRGPADAVPRHGLLDRDRRRGGRGLGGQRAAAARHVRRRLAARVPRRRAAARARVRARHPRHASTAATRTWTIR